MFAIKLILYKGLSFNTYVFDDKSRFETICYQKALKVRENYEKRNPEGIYIIEDLNAEQ